MKQGGGGNHSSGFTIVETLIVLTVTASLAASILLLVAGRQNKTQFQVAINNLQQQLQQIINETSSGFYPNSANFKCDGNMGVVGIVPSDGGPKISAGVNTQGTNQGCIFLGKAVQFSSGGTGHNDKFTVFPLVGNQKVGGGSSQEVSDLAGADPTALAVGQLTNNPGVNDYTTYTAENGLIFGATTFSPALAACNAGTSLIAFVTSFGSYDQTTGLLQSGAQQLGLYAVNPGTATATMPVTCSGTTKTIPQIVDTINQHVFTKIDSVSVCYASGTTKQSGLITIGSGSGSGGLAVTLAIKAGTVC